MNYYYSDHPVPQQQHTTTIQSYTLYIHTTQIYISKRPLCACAKFSAITQSQRAREDDVFRPQISAHTHTLACGMCVTHKHTHTPTIAAFAHSHMTTLRSFSLYLSLVNISEFAEIQLQIHCFTLYIITHRAHGSNMRPNEYRVLPRRHRLPLKVKPIKRTHTHTHSRTHTQAQPQRVLC